MKICLVLASTGEGGLESHVATLANTLGKDAGLDVVVVAPASFGEKLNADVKFVSVDLTCHRRNPLVLWKLLQVLREQCPDVIHAHANKAAAMVSTVRHFCPSRYVATVHGTKRRTGVYRKFDHVIAVSRDVAATLSDIPVTVIHNGVNICCQKSAVTREQLAKEQGVDLPRPMVVAVGRLAPVKGYDLLLQAWQNVDAELLLVGDGPERGRLQSLSGHLGLSEKVHFLGFRKDAGAIMAAADLVVLSSHREGFPLVMVEALQLGVPVVSTAVSGVREILPVEVLVPVGDVAVLAAKVNWVLSLPGESLLAMFREPFRQAREELTLESSVIKTLKLYQSVVGIIS